MENVKQQSCPESIGTIQDKALKAYHGYGYHDLDGNVIYNVSLPPIAEGNICIQKIIKVADNILFIWVHGGTKAYTNPTNNIVTLHFKMYDYIPRPVETPEFYLIHLFHEDSMSETDILNDLKKIITTHCTLTYKMDNKGKEIDIPEQCGNGVLTLQ